MKLRNLATLLVLGLLTSSSLAMQPINARLAGFGGAGVAVAPLPGQTAMRINPAAPALIPDRTQIHLSFLGGGIEREEGEDAGLFGLGTEVYGNLEGATLFGSFGGDFRAIDVNDDDEYDEDDDNLTGEYEISFGAAGSFGGGLLSLGAEGVGWVSAYQLDLDEDEPEYQLGPELYARGGLLLRTSFGLNLGLTYNSDAEDSDSDGDGRVSGGVPSTLRGGIAFQPASGRWLIGGELVSVEDLDLPGGGEILGHEEAHLYSEIYLAPRVALRFAAATLEHQDWDAVQGSLGGSIRMGSRVALDLFARSRSYDYDVEDDDFDETDEESVGGIGITIWI